MVKTLVTLFSVVLFGIPLTVAFFPVLNIHGETAKIFTLVLAPISYVFSFTVCAGLLSIPFRKYIVKGTFTRDLNHPIYGPRRLYGFCWTSVYYFTPLYSIILTIPIFRKILLSLFGLPGNHDFTLYPDTWIRDLPLLKIEEKAYLSNKSTLGSNVCLKDNTILVDGIRIGRSAIVGHMAILGPGTVLEENSEVGASAAFGIRSRVQQNSKVGAGSGINHGTDIGKNTEIGPMSYIGIRVTIRDNIRIPAGSNIKSGMIISSQEEADEWFGSETETLNETRKDAFSLLNSRQSSRTPLSAMNETYGSGNKSP